MAIDNFLTEKEIKIIKLIAENKSNYQIAKEIKLTMYTVGNYITSMLKMFGCKNRYDLVEKFNQIENDPYFKGLTIEKIIELAKKSIRITAYNRELEKKIEDIRKVAYNAYEYYYDKLDTGSNLDDFESIYKICDEIINKKN